MTTCMICNCVLAGTKACENCNNKITAGTDYKYSNVFHVDIPSTETLHYNNLFPSEKTTAVKIEKVFEDLSINIDELKQEVRMCRDYFMNFPLSEEHTDLEKKGLDIILQVWQTLSYIVGMIEGEDDV